MKKDYETCDYCGGFLKGIVAIFEEEKFCSESCAIKACGRIGRKAWESAAKSKVQTKAKTGVVIDFKNKPEER